jgi:hypothetical protein
MSTAGRRCQIATSLGLERVGVIYVVTPIIDVGPVDGFASKFASDRMYRRVISKLLEDALSVTPE